MAATTSDKLNAFEAAKKGYYFQETGKNNLSFHICPVGGATFEVGRVSPNESYPKSPTVINPVMFTVSDVQYQAMTREDFHKVFAEVTRRHRQRDRMLEGLAKGRYICRVTLPQTGYVAYSVRGVDSGLGITAQMDYEWYATLTDRQVYAIFISLIKRCQAKEECYGPRADYPGVSAGPPGNGWAVPYACQPSAGPSHL